MTFAVKCKLCSLPLGESSEEVKDISCLFCIDERNEFYGIFGLEPDGIGSKFNTYWDEIRRYNKWQDRTFYLHQNREILSEEIIIYMRKLKQTCEDKNEP